jgi:hypothetical protein
LFDRLQLADLARYPLLASGELVDVARDPPQSPIALNATTFAPLTHRGY